MKNILVIVGSWVKKGNTDLLADAFIKGAEQAGHQVTKVLLGEKSIEGCRGCNACRWEKPCVIKDDMQGLYPLIEACDMVVLASPLYFWTITARTKAFLERIYAMAKIDPNPPKGRYEKHPTKDCALLMTAADDLFWTFELAVAYYRFNCVNYLGWSDKGMVLAGGSGGSLSHAEIRNTEHLNAAFELGARYS